MLFASVDREGPKHLKHETVCEHEPEMEVSHKVATYIPVLREGDRPALALGKYGRTHEDLSVGLESDGSVGYAGQGCKGEEDRCGEVSGVKIVDAAAETGVWVEKWGAATRGCRCSGVRFKVHRQGIYMSCIAMVARGRARLIA